MCILCLAVTCGRRRRLLPLNTEMICIVWTVLSGVEGCFIARLAATTYRDDSIEGPYPLVDWL